MLLKIITYTLSILWVIIHYQFFKSLILTVTFKTSTMTSIGGSKIHKFTKVFKTAKKSRK